MVVVLLLLIVGAIAAIVYYQQHRGPTGTAPPGGAGAQSVQMLLGNPSGATADPSNRDNYLMLKPYFVLSYNNTKGTANWVSWRVTAADLGDAPRKQVFDPDTTLPPGFKVVTHKDYSGSGFDRGHLCPHGDRAASQEMSFSTFVMTNIIPQAPNVNQKAWAQLESYCRDQVRRRQHLYVIAGPAGRGGRGSNGPAESIAGGKVTVPSDCWKVVVAVPEDGAGGDDLAKITPTTRVIAVDMPNDNDAVGEEWTKYRTSPAAIERRTGFKFFDRLRPDVAEALRQKVDDVRIAPPRPMSHDRD
jgi:endonuclease G